MKPLFRWAGGKTRMLKHYEEIIPKSFDRYVEPFFGGGAMFCHIKNQNPDTECFLNDITPGLMDIYLVIRDDFTQFMKHLNILNNEYIPLKKDERKEYYYHQRYQHAYEYKDWGKIKEAAVFFFLLKTSFNGILQINKNTNNRFGTPAGLLNEKSYIYSEENLISWNTALQNCNISAYDWKESLKNIPKKDAFFFFDPPYRGSFTTYGQDFSDKDQLALLQTSKEIVDGGGKIMLCNRDIQDDFWKEIVFPLKMKTIDVVYTAGRRKKEKDGYSAKAAKELVIFNT